jgi:hypothetical protein
MRPAPGFVPGAYRVKSLHLRDWLDVLLIV